MEDLTFIQIVILVGMVIAGFLASILVVKIGISLNLVELFKYRREIDIGKLQNLCPHSEPVEVSGGLGIRSLFHSPAGTTAYICRQCQVVLYHKEHVEDQNRIWAGDLEGLMKQQEKFQKAARKFYKI